MGLEVGLECVVRDFDESLDDGLANVVAETEMAIVAGAAMFACVSPELLRGVVCEIFDLEPIEDKDVEDRVGVFVEADVCEEEDGYSFCCESFPCLR